MSSSIFLNFLLILFSISFHFKNAQSANPKVRLDISPRMPQVNLPEGERSLLTCAGAGQEPTFFTNLKWIDPKGQEINFANEFFGSNYNIKNKQGSVLLSFLNPTENLSGNYTCKGLFQNTYELSETIQVSFYQDISWIDCPSTQALIKDEKNSLIRCKVAAKPPAELYWSKNGRELPSNRFLRKNEGLIVNGIVDEQLEGKYDIEAHVIETGKIKYASIVVSVYTMPEILELKSEYDVVEDEEAKLDCKATGIPSPNYYWLDPQKKNLSSVGGYIVDTNNGQLIINKVDKEQARGLFTCLVENSAGRVQRTTRINVLSRPRITDFQNRSAIQTSNGFLSCQATGNPAPTIEIRKDGELNSITSGGSFNIEQIKLTEFDTRLNVNIRNAQRSDDGLYYCMASNKIGKTDQIGHLQVEFKPDLSKTPKYAKQWLDVTANLTCIVSSIPNATVSWYFQNHQIFNGEYYTIENEDALSNYKNGYTGVHYLRVHPGKGSYSIWGDYTCKAENKHGVVHTTINLEKARRPSIQEDPDLKNDSPTSILIKFNNNNINDGGMPIKRMFVKYRERNESQNIARREIFPYDNDYILKGLLPRKIYFLSFAVENDVGQSDWTREYEKIMPKESVPDCPKFTYSHQPTTSQNSFNNLNCNANLRPVESNFPDRFDLKWLQPNDNGCHIEFYSVKYYSVVRTLTEWNRIGDYKELFSASNDQLVQHLSGLKPNTTYEVEIRAKNSEGYSQPSRLVFRTAKSNNQSNPSSIRDQVAKKLTDFNLMLIIVLVSIVIILIILDVILFVRYDFGFLFCICHGCSSNEQNRAVKKIKNSHSLNTNYSYHRPSADPDPIIDSLHNPEFKAELENRLIKLPKHSAV